MKYIIIIGALLSSVPLYSQNYKTMVWDALSSLNVLEKPEGNNRYHFKYKVQVLFKDKQQKAVQSEIETVVAKDRIMIKSNQVDFYQDEKNAFTIIKDEKKVLWANSVQKAWQQQDFNGFAQVKKAFFENGTYERITRKEEPKDLQLIKIIPPAEILKKGEIEYMLVELNAKNKQITRMLVYHGINSVQKSTEYIYEKMDLKSSTSILQNIQDYVMSSSTRLKSTYRGFELLDIRKQK